MAQNGSHPVSINLHKKSRILEICFDDGFCFELSCEFLRVYSPSADVKGHGPGQGVLQTGKENVTITELESVGNYAIKPLFDDGHQTGIYSWSYLYDMGKNKEQYWNDYLVVLQDAGYRRDTNE